MRLPSKDSALASSLRVLAYTLFGVLVAYINSPEAVKGIAEYYPRLAQAFVLGAPIAAAIYNIYRKDVPNY